jgi:hypothetical protein
MADISKFALRSFSGKPTRFFRVEREDVSNAAPVKKKSPSHHIFVLDRSGSMYGDIDPMKTMVEKLLTLGEFDDPNLYASLITYSSKGDVTLHFKRVSVSEVMKPNSAHVKAIRSIRATAMTCISQGLEMAETLIDDKEVTCISLHTDGWANDRSPSEEARSIAATIEKLKKHPNAFTNTIAYRGYCDFNLLASISNALSGVCIQALQIKQVYDALHSATALLAGSMSPAIEAPIGGAQYIAFYSESAKKVIGSSDSIVVRGLGAKDDKNICRYYEISEKDYEKLSASDSVSAPIVAFARAQIGEGRLNAAKYAMIATRHATLIKAHAKVMVASDIAKFAEGLETELFSRNSIYTPTKDFGLGDNGPSVLGVLSILDQFSSSLQVNLKALLSGYKRRGVKRIPGSRDDAGALTKPKVESKLRSEEEWVSVNGFDLNRNTATVNMLVNQVIDLFEVGKTAKISKVAGIDLSGLKSFNNYTIVGDGALNVGGLILKTNDKRCFRELKDRGLVSGEYQPNEPFAINLSDLPLVDYDTNFDSVEPDEIRTLVKLTVLEKIFSSMVKGDSASLTADQIEELKKFHLTPALNFSPPTTTEYESLEKAIAEGKVDTRLSYKINVGLPTLTSVQKLASGNAYLQRRFTATVGGKEVEKPTLPMVADGAVWGIKKLSGKTKLDEVDEIAYPLYAGALGLGSTTEVEKLLRLAGAADPKTVLEALQSPKDRDQAIAAATEASKAVGAAIESYYDRVRPLAFYIGATGLVPDSLGATAMTVEQFATKYPETKLSKDEKEEGTFFLLPNGALVTVFVEAVHFSVQQAA